MTNDAGPQQLDSPEGGDSASDRHAKSSVDGVSVAAFVCALPIVTGPLALILGIAGLRRTEAGRAAGRGCAVAGTVLGALGTLAWVVAIGFNAMVMHSINSFNSVTAEPMSNAEIADLCAAKPSTDWGIDARSTDESHPGGETLPASEAAAIRDAEAAYRRNWARDRETWCDLLAEQAGVSDEQRRIADTCGGRRPTGSSGRCGQLADASASPTPTASPDPTGSS